MTVCACALAGNYVEGDEEQRAKREIQVNREERKAKFDDFETEDKKGYLINAGNLKCEHINLKLFKEANVLHIVKTMPNPDEKDGPPLVSDYRWTVPYDFEPISVLSKMHPLSNEVFLYLSKPLGSLDPDKEIEVTSFTMGPNLKRPNNKMDMKNSMTQDYVLFQCFSSTCKEDVSVCLKGKTLIIGTKRYEVGQDDEGEFTNISNAKKSVNLPFPVTLSAFSLTSQGDEGFTIKILKPTTKVESSAPIEIPIQIGTFDF